MHPYSLKGWANHPLLAAVVVLLHLSGHVAIRGESHKGDSNSLESDLGHNGRGSSTPAQPRFDLLVPRNVTVLAGKSAYLSCIVHDLGNKTVSWIRHRDLQILAVGTYTFTSDERFQSSHHKEFEEWTLNVKRAQQRDTGVYECQISTQPITSYFVHLSIVSSVSSSRLQKEWSPKAYKSPSEIYHTMYSDQVPTATISSGPDLHVNKGSTINLTCSIRFSPKPPDYITWYHQDELIPNEKPQIGVSVVNEIGEVTTSRLLVYDADFPDSGKYTCRSSNADETSVTVYVLSGETPAAIQRSSASYLKSSLICQIMILLLFSGI